MCSLPLLRLHSDFAHLAEARSRQSPCRSHCCPPPGSWESSRTCRRCRPIRAKGCGPACARGSPSLSPVHPQYQTEPVEGRKQEKKWWERENCRHAKRVTFTSNFHLTLTFINDDLSENFHRELWWTTVWIKCLQFWGFKEHNVKYVLLESSLAIKLTQRKKFFYDPFAFFKKKKTQYTVFKWKQKSMCTHLYS